MAAGLVDRLAIFDTARRCRESSRVRVHRVGHFNVRNGSGSGRRGTNQIAERLFAAFVAHDLDVVESMMTPDATMSQNGVRRQLRARTPDARGDQLGVGQPPLRTSTGSSVVTPWVEEHRVVSTTPTGHAVNLAACVVVRVNDAGLITSLDEYVDVSRFPTPG